MKLEVVMPKPTVPLRITSPLLNSTVRTDLPASSSNTWNRTGRSIMNRLGFILRTSPRWRSPFENYICIQLCCAQGPPKRWESMSSAFQASKARESSREYSRGTTTGIQARVVFTPVIVKNIRVASSARTLPEISSIHRAVVYVRDCISSEMPPCTTVWKSVTYRNETDLPESRYILTLSSPSA